MNDTLNIELRDRFALADPEQSGASLTELMHAGMDIPSPFMKDIFLLRQAIVGTRYLGGSDELVEELKPGSRISFVAEPENQYDENAVMALDGQGRKLGYIPRHENSIIGALLKAGKSIYGIMPEEQPGVGKANKQTPYSIWVDLYMREFLLPDELSKIPRQGYQGSYAVADFCLAGLPDEGPGPENDREMISEIYAIKVINGEERDTFSGRLKETSEEAERELLGRFRAFAGYLPIVGHDVEEEILPVLEEAYGVLLGIPFSNRVIDTQVMAVNHLPWVRNYFLEALVRELGIEVRAETEAESRCRKIWKLYCRMERSELGKTPEETGEGSAPDRKDAVMDRLDIPVEEYPMSERTKVILQANRILTLRELSFCSAKETAQFRWMDDACMQELKRVMTAADTAFRPASAEKALYGYPHRVRRIVVMKDALWEYRLLFGAVIIYYEWLKNVRTLPLQMWQVQEDHFLFQKEKGLSPFMLEKLGDLKSFVEDFSDAVNTGIGEAIRTARETGSAQAIMDAVGDLMDLYKRIILWRRNFRYLYVKERYRKVIEKLAGMAEDLCASFDELYEKSISVSEQLEACVAGELEPEELDTTMDIGMEIDMEAFQEALKELEDTLPEEDDDEI